MKKRYVYIVECADKTLYTWITIDLDRRIDEHNLSPLWAKYTRARRPVSLVWSLPVLDKSEASTYEYHIKKLPKNKKLALIAGGFELEV